VRELRRCRQMGLKGAMIWASPPEDRPYNNPLYDPFWAAAQDLTMPLSLHAITGMGPESQATRAMG
jgi:predicted TIM-barrel fold metal-dependent hydrolase